MGSYTFERKGERGFRFDFPLHQSIDWTIQPQSSKGSYRWHTSSKGFHSHGGTQIIQVAGWFIEKIPI